MAIANKKKYKYLFAPALAGVFICTQFKEVICVGGEAAEEMVRIMLNGTEVAGRLAGSTAKNLAAILVAWSKNEKKVFGRTSLMKLLNSNEALSVVSMTREQYEQFKPFAKKLFLYAPIVNRVLDDDKVDVVFSGKSAELVNHVLNRIHYGQPARETIGKKEEPEKETDAKKKENPSKSSLSSIGKEGKNSSEKQEKKEPQFPILEKLEQNRKDLNEIVQKKRGPDLNDIVQQIKSRKEIAK